MADVAQNWYPTPEPTKEDEEDDTIDYTAMLDGFIKKEKKELKIQLDASAYGATAEKMAKTLMEEQSCPHETANLLSHLVLYDVVMLLDDSQSMRTKQKGKRKETLKKVLTQICRIFDLANPKGLTSVRFFNGRRGIKDFTEEKVSRLDEHIWEGVTPIGTELKRKILDPFVFKPKEPMKKPLLVMVITDGEVEGEKTGLLESVIKYCTQAVAKDTTKGTPAVSFHFSCVGNDKDAQQLLRRLDNHKEIGDYVDCMLRHRLENIEDEDQKWIILSKLLLGGIMARFDDNDDEGLNGDIGEQKDEDVQENDEFSDDD